MGHEQHSRVVSEDRPDRALEDETDSALEDRRPAWRRPTITRLGLEQTLLNHGSFTDAPSGSATG